MKITNPQGTWFQSIAAFPIVDPESGTVFEPAVPTKATATDWVKSQPAIELIADPLATTIATKVVELKK